MNTTVLQDMEHANADYGGLWRITAGERLRYLIAIIAMALTNLSGSREPACSMAAFKR